MKNSLIIGGDSTIGRALMHALAEKNIACAATSRRKDSPHIPLDLADDPGQWPELPPAEVAYICAAITKLEACENEEAATRLINVIHTQKLIEKLQAQGTHAVFLSSNQVFDGEAPYRKTSEATSPKNAYGRQKAEMEKWLLARPASACILRLSKIVAGEIPIIAQWEKSLLRGEAIEAFNDLVFAPLPLENAISTLVTLGEKKSSGILHLSGEHDISYFTLAQELAKKLGVAQELVVPSSARSKGIPPQFLPKHGTLENSII